ncbi:hypothetical protein ACTQWG_04795 [Blautia sp. HCP3S3_H10_1]|uniref:hypothetical protein n=1 Tax=unclassified Blautia TaxID=2648079 RepID=UPI003F91AF6B
MKSFKKIAVTVLATVMMLLMSVTVFAADSPVKTSFNASLAKKTVTYNAKKQTPKVVVKDANGKTINKKYYKVTYSKQGFKNAGKYKVTITGKGKYAGYKETITYTIKSKAQKVTLKKDSFSTTKKAVKKKAKSIGTIKATTRKGAKVTYTTNNSKIKVSKNGKITVAKGTKKGTYQIKVTVRTKNYKTVNKFVKITVK